MNNINSNYLRSLCNLYGAMLGALSLHITFHSFSCQMYWAAQSAERVILDKHTTEILNKPLFI